MASLTDVLVGDPTLHAADRALEAQSAANPYRSQRLGMGQAAHECDRFLWYVFRWAFKEGFDAPTLKRFADGHLSEDIMAERLRLVPGIVLVTVDPETGDQFTYLDCDGHAKGKCDGKITGILQAPVKKHIWEAKATSEKKLTEFRKIKAQIGEKAALKKWNPVYYGQAQLYMHYEGTDRHYMTISSPGVRDWDSCRTEYDPTYVTKLRARMARIIKSDEPGSRISDKPDWFQCKMCPARGICHEGAQPDRTCRTCLHATAIENGLWHCQRYGKTLTAQEQNDGCPSHLYLPPLVPGDVTEVGDTSVTYKMKDGSIWTDSEANNG